MGPPRWGVFKKWSLLVRKVRPKPQIPQSRQNIMKLIRDAGSRKTPAGAGACAITLFPKARPRSPSSFPPTPSARGCRSLRNYHDYPFAIYRYRNYSRTYPKPCSNCLAFTLNRDRKPNTNPVFTKHSFTLFKQLFGSLSTIQAHTQAFKIGTIMAEILKTAQRPVSRIVLY